MEKKDSMVNIELKVITSQGTHTVLADEQVLPLDYEITDQLHKLECIQQEINLDSASRPHIAWQLINATASTLATEYPTYVHFFIAREALKNEEIKIDGHAIDRKSKSYKDIVIRVANRLNECLRTFQAFATPPKPLKEALDLATSLVDSQIGKSSALDIIDLSELIPEIDSHFLKQELFVIDASFLHYLENIGKNGKEVADNLRPKFEKHYESFKKSGKYPLGFFFNLSPSPDKPIFFAFAWFALATAIWRDEVKQKATFIIEAIPTIIENDQKHIIEMLSREKTIEQTDDQIQVFSHGLLLGTIQIPMISKQTIKAVLTGINKINLIEGHRVLRYIPRTAFNQAISGDTDYRVIRRESFSEIADELKLKAEKSRKNMTDVFEMMAFFNFERPNFSSNLITLKRFKSAKTHRLEGVEITVGTALLPYRACDDFKSGESNLMIPILSDPLLVGSNQYHAGQFLLQMLVMGEFVKQSVEFSKTGMIKITQENWQTMAQESGVTPILNKILDRWTQDGVDGPKFLEKINENFYMLGSTYHKEIEFLKRQGLLRIKQSNRGKTSSIKRKAAKK